MNRTTYSNKIKHHGRFCYRLLTKTEKGKSLEDDFNPGNYDILQAETLSGRVFTAFKDYIEIYYHLKMQTPSERNYHEVIYGNKYQKLRFDIDISAKDYTGDIDILAQTVLDDTVDAILKTFSLLYTEPFSIEDILVCSSHGVTKDKHQKRSFHLIIPKYCVAGNEEAKNFYEKVVTLVPMHKQYLDSGVYTSKKNFRTLYSTKLGEDRFKTYHERWIHRNREITFRALEDDPTEVQWMEYSLITCVVSCEKLPSLLKKVDQSMEIKIQKDIPDFIHDRFTEARDKLDKGIWKADSIRPHINYQTKRQNGFRMGLIRRKSAHCEVCDRTHDSNGAYIHMTYRGEMRYHCLAKKYEPNAKNYVQLLKGDDKIKKKLMAHYSDYEHIFTVPKSNSKRRFTKDHWDNIQPSTLKHVDERSSDAVLKPLNLELISNPILKAACGMGKTECITPALSSLDKNISILSITFRRTLASKQKREYEKYGFITYDDSNINHLGVIKAHRLIVQIDSLHKVRGHYDIIILDETVYTMNHLFEFVKEKHRVWTSLVHYMTEAKHVLSCDAFAGDDVITLYDISEKKPYVYYNDYPKHKDKTVYLTDDRSKMDTLIHKDISHGKRLIICSNSEKYITAHYNKLTEKYPNLKVKAYTAKTHDGSDPTHEWTEYDIILYSPTLTAGNSFTKMHFHKCYAYFTDRSCMAEMAVQQLFRCRCFIDGVIILNIRENYPYYIPANSVDDIETYLLEADISQHRDIILHNPNIEGALSLITINYGTDEIDSTNPFFKLYAHYIYRKNESNKWYTHRLMSFLKSQGLNYGGDIDIETSDIKLQLAVSKEYSQALKAISKEECEAVANARVLDHAEYADLCKKMNPTNDDKLAIRKHYIKTSYRINDESITADFVRIYESKIQIMKRLEIILPLKDLPNDELTSAITNIADNLAIPPQVLTIQHRLYDNELINKRKMIYLINILSQIGFNSPFDTKVIKNSVYKKSIFNARKYILDNKDDLLSTFNCKITLNDKSDIGSILKWINERLSSFWGIKVTRKYDNSNADYMIKGFDIWEIDGRTIQPIDTKNQTNDVQVNVKRSAIKFPSVECESKSNIGTLQNILDHDDYISQSVDDSLNEPNSVIGNILLRMNYKEFYGNANINDQR